MTGIEPETLMAYADGELDPIAAKRVERAIADDPALGEEVERHRALSARLRGGFAPVAASPVPPAIEQMLRDSAKVVPLVSQRRATRIPAAWATAVAASLVVGLLAGQMIPHGDTGGIALEGGQAVARGEVAVALTTQLASTQGDAKVRIGLTFRDGAGDLCRTFRRDTVSGIACADGGDWRLTRLYGGDTAAQTEYRQAGSPDAAMMADVQAMAAGDPLDADQERRALEALRPR